MALYNGGFPATYTPVYPTYTPVPQQSNAQQNGIIWVQGEAGAKSYLVAPNNTVQLWDSESQTIYLKSADASGMPSMKVLDYSIRQTGANAPNSLSGASDNNSINYATKDEIKAISDEIEAIKSKVESMTKRRARLMEEFEDE